MSEKKFFESQQTVTLGSCQELFKFLETNTKLGFDHWKEHNQMNSGDMAPFIERYGKQHFCSSDSANRRLYCWKVELTECTFWVILGKTGRGTTYEFILNDGYTQRDAFNAIINELRIVFGWKLI